MTLIKFEPLRELENWNEKIHRFFNDFQVTDFNYYPHIDISDDENNIYVEAEIPGVKKEDIKITLQDNILTISGEKKNTKEEKDKKNFFRSERVYGSFTRSFTLPEDINPDSVEAKFENGILNISIQKAQPKKTAEKFIQVK
ncbi:MAG: heat-shock protein Hsp20 [Ignavibacteria bacterium GWA2_35_9]|nr:MAG: heat-shock protein Hsp20 [Ignavibacteria bacterium GWA2_35_9]OGU46076.1 MAG: heat-shock protein Hsp20 [Ignavibacteria bacterium GWB2_36_8]OGU51778.1 MAG: heat-shock protein Hsp20 [Ignavibacteria bacterium GWC2_36_12]OGV01861.1 MAG: heat-shock protein Hsp20 [Ignavibacteria bacterium RIFOXYA2_FULL_37_17]